MLWPVAFCLNPCNLLTLSKFQHWYVQIFRCTRSLALKPIFSFSNPWSLASRSKFSFSNAWSYSCTSCLSPHVALTDIDINIFFLEYYVVPRHIFTYVPFDITSCSTTILLWDTWVKWRIIMFESWGLLHSNFSQSDYTMSTLTLLYLWRQNKGVRHSKKKIADRALLWPNLVACTPSSVSSI